MPRKSDCKVTALFPPPQLYKKQHQAFPLTIRVCFLTKIRPCGSCFIPNFGGKFTHEHQTDHETHNSSSGIRPCHKRAGRRHQPYRRPLRGHRHNIENGIRPVRRASRSLRVRGHLGRRRFPHTQHQRIPQRCPRGSARVESAGAALARRLLCRRLPLARRHRRSGKTPNID